MSRARAACAITAVAFSVTGCSRPTSTSTTEGADAATASPNPSSGASGGSGGPSAPARAAGPATWTGTYNATPGTLFVPDGGEWSGVKFRGDDASIGLGAGTLTLAIDGATGRAEGTGDGALGPVIVRGLLREGTLSARIDPKDVAAGGFTGFVLGKLEGDAIKGTMRLSTDTGNVIREGTFTLAQK
jgi:hypothetical protein